MQMPRTPSTCSSFKLPLAEWCFACKDKKGGCLLKGNSTSGSSAGASQEVEALPKSSRSRKEPGVIYEPEELPSRPLPEVPAQMAVQRARAAEIAHERQLELEAARTAGAEEARAAAEQVVLEAQV